MRLTWLDWSLVLLYILAVVGAGLISRRRVKSISDFLVAGRQIRYHLGVATLVATELGLVTMMYFAEQGYRFGIAAFIIGIIWAAAYYTIGSTGFIVDRIRQLDIVTITEYFEVRFSRGVRVLGAILIIIAGVLSLGVFLKLGAVFLIHFMNIPETYHHITLTLVVSIVILYTMAGGMISIVLTDYVQFVVLAFAMVFTTIFVLAQFGYMDFFSRISEMYATQGLDPLHHEEYGWSFIGYWTVFAISGCVLWQPVTQRIFAAQSPEVNRFIFKSTSMMFLARAFFPIVWGVGAALYFGTGSDAVAGMPMFLTAILPVGMLGLFGASMFAAMMSTDAGYIHAWSTIIVQDLINPLRGGILSDAQRLLWTRISILGIGLLMLFFGIWYQLKDTAFRYLLDVTTIYYAGGLAVLVGGLYWKRATTVGAYAAFACGALLPLAAVVEDIVLQTQGSTLTGYFAQLFSPNIRGLLSFAFGFGGLIIGSLVSTQKVLQRT